MMFRVALTRDSIILSCAGNEYIHWLTNNKRYELRVELTDFNGDTVYATYDEFRVDSEPEQYKLSSLGSYNGTAGYYGISTT